MTEYLTPQAPHDVEATAPQTMNAEALSHQRPDDVLGEWSNIPEEDWNIHQRIAEKTGGWVTAANVVSIVGGALTVKGGIDYARGNRAKGVAFVGVGRLLDLADGYVAKKLGTRGKTGALVDAGIDKAVTLGAAVELAVTDTIEPEYAAASAVQQGRIFAHNALIEKAGGNPNPSKAGKHGMFAFWVGVGARAVEKLTEQRNPAVARWAGRLATVSETASIALTEQAIDGYKQQRKTIKLADK